MRRPWRYGDSARPCALSRSGVAFTEFANCLRKDVALVSHCVPGLGRSAEERGAVLCEARGRFRCFLRHGGWGDGTFHVHRLVAGGCFRGVCLYP